jgi:hypothetical protein
MLYAVCCMLYAVCCMLYAVCCMLYAVCCMLYAVCCMLYAVCCTSRPTYLLTSCSSPQYSSCETRSSSMNFHSKKPDIADQPANASMVTLPLRLCDGTRGTGANRAQIRAELVLPLSQSL